MRAGAGGPATWSSGGTGHLATHTAAPGTFSGPFGMPWPSQGVPLAAAAGMSMPHGALAATEVAAKPVSSSASTEKTATKRRMSGAHMIYSVATNHARIKWASNQPLCCGVFGVAPLEAAAGPPWPAWAGWGSASPASVRHGRFASPGRLLPYRPSRQTWGRHLQTTWRCIPMPEAALSGEPRWKGVGTEAAGRVAWPRIHERCSRTCVGRSRGDGLDGG